jgi:hypothetical protein
VSLHPSIERKAKFYENQYSNHFQLKGIWIGIERKEEEKKGGAERDENSSS